MGEKGEDLGGGRGTLSEGPPSPSKPPSSSPNFPEPGSADSASELSVLRGKTRCGWTGAGQTPAQESFCWIGAVRKSEKERLSHTFGGR